MDTFVKLNVEHFFTYGYSTNIRVDLLTVNIYKRAIVVQVVSV